MSLFKPSIMKKRITDITAEMLKEMGVSALLLDVDNTLVSYVKHEPIAGAVEWTKEMKAKGFEIIIVSNNYKKRVAPFAAKFNLPYITFAMKPFPFGYIKASKRLKTKCKQCAIIGDQIFTDIIGANMCGMKSILLEPIELESGITITARRKAEGPLRKKYVAQGLCK